MFTETSRIEFFDPKGSSPCTVCWCVLSL